MRIALAGTGYLGVSLLGNLLDSRHEVVAVIQNGRKTRGMKRRLSHLVTGWFAPRARVTGIARGRGIPIVWIDKMSEDELRPLRVLEPDLVLVGGFGIILKRALLDLPRIGCVNTHGSLLPKHRGPNPFSAVLAADEAETGVTFHVMDEGIDTGDLLDQYAFPIEATDTAGIVYQKCSALAGEHVAAVVDRIEAEGLRGTPQDSHAATYDKRFTAEDAAIRWEKPAKDIERLVRAAMPFLSARFTFRGRTVYVREAAADPAPVDAEPGTVVTVEPPVRIATGQGTLRILVAHSLALLPWSWPAPWNRPRSGEKVS